jgi:hypothetical protein
MSLPLADRIPVTLLDVQNAGSTLSKVLWPGSYTVTLPVRGTGRGSVTPILSGANQVGAVFSPGPDWASVLLEFAGVGAADQTLVVEIGRVAADGALAQPLASVSLKSITTSGTVANKNPFTGEATAGVTWRLFDLVTITAKAQLGQVLTTLGGTEDETPGAVVLDTSESVYYYVLVTNLNSLTRALVVLTPQG